MAREGQQGSVVRRDLKAERAADATQLPARADAGGALGAAVTDTADPADASQVVAGAALVEGVAWALAAGVAHGSQLTLPLAARRRQGD